MKKILISCALAALAVTAQAQVTAVAELDFHKYSGLDSKSTYWSVGLVAPTQFGTFDGSLQGVRAVTSGTADNLAGFEFGYTVPGLAIDSVSISPRIAYGEMGNIDMGFGQNGTGRYFLGSVEANMPLKPGLNGYVGYSHMSGQNAAAIQSQNRVQVGVDVALTKQFTARIGYSAIRQYQTTQQGLVTMAYYTF
jgi:hypothetical protein